MDYLFSNDSTAMSNHKVRQKNHCLEELECPRDQDYQQADPSGHWVKQHKVARRRLKINQSCKTQRAMTPCQCSEYTTRNKLIRKRNTRRKISSKESLEISI